MTPRRSPLVRLPSRRYVLQGILCVFTCASKRRQQCRVMLKEIDLCLCRLVRVDPADRVQQGAGSVNALAVLLVTLGMGRVTRRLVVWVMVSATARSSAYMHSRSSPINSVGTVTNVGLTGSPSGEDTVKPVIAICRLRSTVAVRCRPSASASSTSEIIGVRRHVHGGPVLSAAIRADRTAHFVPSSSWLPTPANSTVRSGRIQ